MKRLIVTGDDFGASPEVNEAVDRAHRDGILTAASLMVGAPAAEDAVARARNAPTLGVGLHVVVVRGRSVLAPAEIPDIVDDNGRFEDNLVRAGFRYFFSPRARRQLAAEIRAQFEAFAATGLALDHANAHNHMQLHPTVLSLIVSIGRAFGLRAMRLPYEPTGTAARILLAPWIGLMRRRLKRAGLRHNDYLFGIASSGGMDRAAMIAALERLPDGVSEIMTHPATGRWDGVESAAAGYRFADELAALTDADVRSAADRSGAHLGAFAALG